MHGAGHYRCHHTRPYRRACSLYSKFDHIASRTQRHHHQRTFPSVNAKNPSGHSMPRWCAHVYPDDPHHQKCKLHLAVIKTIMRKKVIYLCKGIVRINCRGSRIVHVFYQRRDYGNFLPFPFYFSNDDNMTFHDISSRDSTDIAELRICRLKVGRPTSSTLVQECCQGMPSEVWIRP